MRTSAVLTEEGVGRPWWRTDEHNAHLLRAALVGLIAGLLAVGFRWALTGGEHAREALLAHLHTGGGTRWWHILILPAIGMTLGSVVGWFMVRFAPEAGGSGIPHVKGVLLHLQQLRWKTLVPIKFIGGVLGIGAGLSMGREGPTVQMGAAVGRAVADVCRVPERSVPQLLSCGAGAGIAAAFNAPLAGFLFVIEELHRELSARTFGGALVAALVAAIVARMLGGDQPSFEVAGFTALPLKGLPIAVLVGVLGGLGGTLFNRMLLSWSDVAADQKVMPRWLLPGVAAAMCGLVAWWIPDAVGGGHNVADQLLSGKASMALGGLAVLLVAKFVMTGVSYASGAPGGVFAPMLLLGVLLGMIVDTVAGAAIPAAGSYMTALSILGMGAIFTGSVRAPLTGIVLMVELTGDYHQLLSLAVACLSADLIAQRVRGKPLYEELLEANLRRRQHSENADAAIAMPRSVYIGVQRGSSLEGKSIRDAALPAGCLVVGIERFGRDVMPEAHVVLHAGDHLTVLIGHDEPEKAMALVALATGL